jgi:hypothetical protein
MVEKETKTEKSKVIDYDGLIDDIIKKIDNEKSLFTLRDQLHGYSLVIYIIFLYVMVAVIVMFLPIGSLIERVTFAIAVLALLLTYVSFTSERLKNNIIEANFEKAIEIFKIGKTEKEKGRILLLKALIKMKAINSSSDLGTVKEMHPEMFTKEMLMERLYE